MSKVFSQSSSELELKATILGLKISRNLFRQIHDLDKSLQAVVDLLARSKLFSGAMAELQRQGEESRIWTSGDLHIPGNQILFAELEKLQITVSVWLATPHWNESNLQLLSEYSAQQLALFAETRALEAANEALRVQVQIERESLTLRKLMERAKAIISARSPLSAEQAEEFLVASSVRTGRPLLKVAHEVVLAFGAPERSFNWRGSRGPRRSRDWSRAVA